MQPAARPSAESFCCGAARRTRPRRRFVLSLARIALLGLVGGLLWGPTAQAQLFSSKTSLAPAEVDLLEGAAASLLAGAPRQLAEMQWEEALDAVRRVGETQGDKFLLAGAPASAAAAPSPFRRYLPVRDICQQRLAAWSRTAPPALALYRRQVDAQAEALFRQAQAEHDPRPLARVVGELAASSWADDAALLWADYLVGDGDYLAARSLLTRIAPLAVPAELPRLLERPEQFPEPSVPAAEARARLVLCSLLAGDETQAAQELAWFAALHPQASGRLAGRSGLWTELLREFAEKTALARREATAVAGPAPFDPAGQPRWRVRLPRLTSDRDLIGAGRLRVGDDMKSLRSYFPVVWRDQVLVRADARGDSLLASFGLADGALRWRVNYPRQARRDEEPPADDGLLGEVNDAHADLARHLGVARYEVLVAGEQAFVRLGSPLSGPRARRLDRQLAKDQGFLLGLDLHAEGKPLEGFPLRPESNDWAFEGPPVAAAGRLYCVQRRVEGARSQWTVACFELLTSPAAAQADDEDDARPTGRMLWRQRVASAATLGGGSTDEIGSAQLLLAHGRLFCQTNAGAVAALDAETGRIFWVTTYERSALDPSDGRSGLELFRDANPPLLAGERLICLPQDSSRLFALEPLTGRIAWSQAAGVATDATHLVGAQGPWVVAAGDRAYWFEVATGRLGAQFPAGPPSGVEQAVAGPRGLGRGLLHGGQFYWPTREAILIFNPPPLAAEPRPPAPVAAPQSLAPVREIALVPRGLTGGNLVAAGELLLIATGEELAALGPHNPPRAPGSPPSR